MPIRYICLTVSIDGLAIVDDAEVNRLTEKIGEFVLSELRSNPGYHFRDAYSGDVEVEVEEWAGSAEVRNTDR